MEENEQLEKIKVEVGRVPKKREFSGDQEAAASRLEGPPELTLEQTEDLKSKAASG